MNNFRDVVVTALITGLLAGGCQTERPATVAEYRPNQPLLVEHSVPKSEVFQLIRWQPISPATTLSASTTRPVHPTRQEPIEVQRLNLAGGRPIGFRRNDGRLIAIAGDNSIPLIESHYEWKTMPSQAVSSDHRKLENVNQQVTGWAYLGAAIGATFYFIWHYGVEWICDFLNATIEKFCAVGLGE